MHFEVYSLFPEYIQEPLKQSILKRAIAKGQIRVTCEDIRQYSQDSHRRVDDRPYGGGPGMVLMADPVVRAIQEKKRVGAKVLYLSPQGRRLTPRFAKELAQEEHVILLAGHYEGVDQRALDTIVDEEISIGDYVLTNGCLAALVVIDVVSRYIPGVLGDERASENDSFESCLLDFPHYTRPEVYDDMSVPSVLLGGNHKEIEGWRKGKAIEATWIKRPDLFSKAVLSTIPIESSSSTHLCQIALPSAHFSATCRFYKELFSLDPTRDNTYGIEKASWMLHESNIMLTLYSVPFQSNTTIVSSVLEIALEHSKCLKFLAWLFRKLSGFFTCASLEENPEELFSQDEVVSYLRDHGGITILDPSGHRVYLRICKVKTIST